MNRTIKIGSSIKLSVLLLLFFCVAIFLRNFISQLRHLNYLIFPLAAVLLVVYSHGKIILTGERKTFFLYSMLWVAIIGISLLFGIGEISLTRFLKEFYFVVASLLATVLLFSFASIDNIHRALKYLLWLSLIISVLAYPREILNLIQFDVVDFLINSTSDTETILSYFIGVLSLFFFLKKERWPFAVSLFLVILSSKRAVYIGVVGCIMAYYFLKPFAKIIINHRNSVALLFTLLNLGIAYLIFLLIDGYFDDIIIQYTGIAPNSFFKGRIATYQLVLEYTGGLPWIPRGLGFINGVLIDSNFPLEQMHSDLLKYYIEFGIVLGSCIIFALYRMCAKDYRSFVVLLYYNFNSLVGNVSIYLEFTFVFYIVILLFLLESAGLKKQNLAHQYSEPAG